MSGVFFRLNHTFTSGFNIDRDPVLSPGSLLLLEPARDNSDNLLSLENYANGRAVDLGISGAERAEIVSGLQEFGLLERTGSGAIHGIVTEGALAAGRQASVRNLPVLQYIESNRDHEFAVMATVRMTRNASVYGTSNISERECVLVGSASPQMVIFQSRTTGNLGAMPYPHETRTGFRSEQIGPANLAGISAFSPSGSVSQGRVAIWGGRSYSPDGGYPSYILYRLYIEDLTVSGRTFEEVADIESSIAKARFSEGGLYFNDTFTDPSTIP